VVDQRVDGGERGVGDALSHGLLRGYAFGGQGGKRLNGRGVVRSHSNKTAQKEYLESGSEA
jgi:hypothetical protein